MRAGGPKEVRLQKTIFENDSEDYIKDPYNLRTAQNNQIKIKAKALNMHFSKDMQKDNDRETCSILILITENQISQ